MKAIFDHFAFAEPWWLLGLLVIPPLLFLRNRAGARSFIDFPSLAILSSVGSQPREGAGGVAPTLLCLVLLFGILGLARPQWRNTYVARSASGIDILIALDVSRSMDIQDYYEGDDRTNFPQRRIDAAKDVLEIFVAQRADDRIGMVGFGARPYAVSPITLDHDWLIANMKRLRIGDIDPDGTAIGSAIAAATTRLTDREAKSKIIVLVTDGASNSGKLDPVQAARLAASLGVRVYTVGIGSEEGRLSRRHTAVPRQEFDTTTLREIARITGAEFYRATTTAGLRNTFASINDLEKSEVQSQSVVEARELFGWCVGASFVFAFLSLSSFALNPPPVP